MQLPRVVSAVNSQHRGSSSNVERFMKIKMKITASGGSQRHDWVRAWGRRGSLGASESSDTCLIPAMAQDIVTRLFFVPGISSISIFIERMMSSREEQTTASCQIHSLGQLPCRARLVCGQGSMILNTASSSPPTSRTNLPKCPQTQFVLVVQ